jgi:hypothetical protein
MRNDKTFTWIAVAIFTLMAVVHIIRLFTDFQIIIGSHTIPMWVSYVGIVVPLGLAWMLCREARGRPTA